VGGGALGVGVAGRLVAVGVAGRLVAVGGTVVGVGVSVTSGVGVTVGVSVAVGVGECTGVGEWVDVGVKVGLGVLVDVGVAVGDPMNDVKEQPRRLTMTSTATNAAVVVVMSFLLVIAKPADLLSPRKRHTISLTSQSGSWKTSRLWTEVRPSRASLAATPGGQGIRHARTCAGRLCPCAALSMPPFLPAHGSGKGALDHPGF